MSTLLSNKTLEPFGEINYNGVKTLSNNFINLSNFKNDYYKIVCKNIIENKDYDYNYSLLKKSVYNSTTKDYNNFNTFIFETFRTLCEDIKNKILNLIKNNKFNPHIFINIYNEYNDTSKKLKDNIFYYYDKSTKITKNNKSYSYLNLIKNISFYNIVLKNNYVNDKSITDLLSEYILNNFYNILDIIKIYELYEFYDRLCYTSNQNIINNSLHESFFKNFECSEKFIKKLCIFIDQNIVNSFKNKEEDCVYLKKNIIRNMFKKIKDIDVFYLYYYQLLSKRIFENKTNIDLEINMSKEICDFSNDIYRKINMQINDMINNINETKIYRSLPVDVESKKYEKIKNEIDTSKIKIFNLKKYAWDSLITCEENNLSKILPLELDAYINIYNKYYNIRYTNRKLIWDFDNSNIKLSFVINDKKYFFDMNINQASVLLLFNNSNEFINIDYIQKNTNLKVNEIKNIIDSFVYIKLINISKSNKIDDDKNNDTFYINKLFNYEGNYISFKKIVNLKNKSNLSKENKVQIFNIINDKLNISTDELYTIIMKQNKIIIKKEELKNLLLEFQKIGMIEEKNNKWLIIESESESSEDSD